MTPESPGGEGLTDLVRELAEMLDHAIVCELEEAEMAAALDATKRARAALAALPASPAPNPGRTYTHAQLVGMLKDDQRRLRTLLRETFETMEGFLREAEDSSSYYGGGGSERVEKGLNTLRGRVDSMLAAYDPARELASPALRERLAAAEAERDDLKAVRDIELAHVSMSRDEEAQARIEALERELMEARRDGDTCAAASLAHAKLVGERDVQIAAERHARERAEAALGRARELLAGKKTVEHIPEQPATNWPPNPPEPAWDMCLECGNPVEQCDAEADCWGASARAFLAAPAHPGTGGEPCMACKGTGGRLLGEGVTAHFDQCRYCGGIGRSRRAAGESTKDGRAPTNTTDRKE